ncbi:MAG: PD-(D/E)XK nuclease family protein [Chloroflexota bacterium]|nr:PD-(D/E)XK nuclease family protein [Chloroflexota bacterium]MDP6756628.1 PD-(D/E)XK nuclease family protein [Chloroflexota bacterium]
MRFSYTKLSLYDFCPWAYNLRYIEKIRVPFQPRLLAGAVVHNVISDFLERVRDGLSLGIGDLETIFDGRWRSARILDRDGTGDQRRSALGLVNGFWQSNSADFGRPLMLEERFRMPIGSDSIEGIVDRVEDIGSGEVEVIDYKSGSAPAGDPARDSLQLSIYALACRDHWGLRPRRVSLYYLTDNTKSTATVDAAKLEATRAAIVATGSRIAAADFPPDPGKRCEHCDFAERCEFRPEPSPNPEQAG